MQFGVQRREENERLKKEKDEKELKEYGLHEIELKERLARYPWINEEMGQRKTDCCERLHHDALRRLGLPLPEYGIEEITKEMLSARFDCPTIY